MNIQLNPFFNSVGKSLFCLDTLQLSIDPRPSTNQSTSFKSGSLFLVMVSIRTSVRTRTYVQNTSYKEFSS